MVITNKKKNVETQGFMGWTIGLLTIIFAITQPAAGIIFGIIGLRMNKKTSKKELEKVGRKLSLAGLIISLILLIIAIIAATTFSEQLLNLQGISA